LVAFPTETVYGLGADALNEQATQAIFLAKSRPACNPLIVHVLDVEQAERYGRFDPLARRLADTFWPGPLTLVMPLAATHGLSVAARAGLDSVALRAPAHPVARALLRAAERPVAAPSANRSGAVSPTLADHVMADLAGRIDLVLDGGPTRVGLESTIVACLEGEPRVLRPGGLSRAEIERALGRPLAAAAEAHDAVRAPGMLASHYAPRAALRLDAETVAPGESALDFGGRLLGAALRLDLSSSGDLAEAAARLYACLRRLDEAGAHCIAVAPIPHNGLGEAINDRLRRAAAPRDAMLP
jgi:L-threonylcarbamoyladenylate synthase